MNSILIYMSDRFINWSYTADAIFGWLGQLAGDPLKIVLMACCYVLVKWIFLYVLQALDGMETFHDALGVIEAVYTNTELVFRRKTVRLSYVAAAI